MFQQPAMKKRAALPAPWRKRGLPVLLGVALTTMAVSLAAGAQRGEPTPEHDVESQPNVLFLTVDDFTRPYMRLFFEAFTDTVTASSNPPAIFFESLDASRFQEEQYLEEAREWLRRKYAERRIDLIVAPAEDALAFLAASRGEPWPAAKVLYFESGSVRIDTRRSLPQAGGMLLEDHFADALAVVRAILPDTKYVALAYGASKLEVSRWGGFAEKVKEANLEPIELVGVSMDETRAAIARLPAHAVVFVLAPTVDAQGKVLSSLHVCELIASAGTVPTLTLESFNLGCGAVGGLLRDWAVIGRLLGEEAAARLRNPSTDVVTVPVAKYTTLAFDARQLQLWNIPERRLPNGAVVRFREPNVWRDYRGLVLTAIAVTLVQSLLIAGLVFEHRRRRVAEIESRRNLAAMAHLDRRAAMGELATSLAHELNQPLNAILQNAGVAEMLLASNGVPAGLGEIPEIVSDIRKDDIRASEIIRRMRGLLQKHELESHPVDLNDVAQETIAVVRADARSRGIELDLALADDVPPILGDRVHLQQVLLNLLMNAMDAVAAMPPDRRGVRVSITKSDGEVRLAVADTGRGIAAERISQIFEPFYTTKGEGSGMGMGLAIARSIVQAHAGRMAAENNPGGGATVGFSLPTPSGPKP